MKITFLCPMPLYNPVGGLKVVIEYANRLAQRGHCVTLVAATGNVPYDRQATSQHKIKRTLLFLLRSLGYKGGYKPDRWIRLAQSVRLLWRPSLDVRWIPDADVVIATAWESAEWAAAYPDSKGRKFYLIQNDESAFTSDPVLSQRAQATWKLPLKKLVTGKWLQTFLASRGESACWVSQGVDYQDSYFSLMRPIDTRSPTTVIMMYHVLPWKGSADGLAALNIVKQTVDTLTVRLFGTPNAPPNLPAWIEYVQNPPQRQLCALYNASAIFVSPSWVEGMALPPAEAMQCGAAVCLTQIGGHADYGIHQHTALLSPPRQPEALAVNILQLIENPHLRIQLAMNGHQYIQRFTWESAVNKFEQCITAD